MKRKAALALTVGLLVTGCASGLMPAPLSRQMSASALQVT